MKKLLALSAAVLLVGAGCSSTSQVDVNTAVQPGDNQPMPAPTAQTDTQAKASIMAMAQKPGNQIIVDAVTLTNPGYVVIHADDNGKPGKILGHSVLLSAGTHAKVTVSIATANKIYYWAMIHADNGNGTFVAEEDLPTKDENGAGIMSRFETETAAETGSNTKDETNVGAKVDMGGVKVDVGASANVNVTIQSFAFSPSIIKVKKGGKIVFTNKDSASHTVTADKGAFASGTLETGQSFTLDTSKLAPGSYAFSCAFHANMKGTVVVE